nr:MAG TPA: hypothetical protein [Caudoviricetes sp.]
MAVLLGLHRFYDFSVILHRFYTIFVTFTLA